MFNAFYDYFLEFLQKLIEYLGINDIHKKMKCPDIYDKIYYYKDIGYEKIENQVNYLNKYLPNHSIPPNIIFFGFGISTLFLIIAICKGIKHLLRHINSLPLPKDIVMVYQMPTGKTVPSLSPFVLKLETYLRMAGIPYKIDTRFIKSSEGKVPWISHNGLEIADSQLCIEYFNRKFAVDYNKHLSDREKAVARAFRILAESDLIWTLVMYRFLRAKSWLSFLGNQLHMGKLQKLLYYASMLFLFKRRLAKRAKSNGIGYRKDFEVAQQCCADLQSISTFLGNIHASKYYHPYAIDCFLRDYFVGNKSYFMGEQPSEVDASMFGMLAQFMWTLPEDHFVREKFTKEFTNLAAYCVRVKQRFWPDWDARLQSGKLCPLNATAKK